MIVDGFLPNYPSFKEYAIARDFTGTINPVDGVLYPDVTTDIPVEVSQQIQDRLDWIFARTVIIHMMFMRLTTSNTEKAPHQAHTDAIMGQYTFLLYLSEGGGTSLVEHIETGMTENPKTEAEVDVWRRDTNTPEAWKIREMVEMKENRAYILNAQQLHRAEPVDGFGDGPDNGRLVLTAFFS